MMRARFMGVTASGAREETSREGLTAQKRQSGKRSRGEFFARPLRLEGAGA